MRFNDTLSPKLIIEHLYLKIMITAKNFEVVGCDLLGYYVAIFLVKPRRMSVWRSILPISTCKL